MNIIIPTNGIFWQILLIRAERGRLDEEIRTSFPNLEQQIISWNKMNEEIQSSFPNLKQQKNSWNEMNEEIQTSFPNL